VSWLDLLLIPLGFGVAAYGTMVGAGGGFILVPALLLIFPDESQKTLTAISLLVVLANALSGTFAYARRRLVDYRTGLTFACVAIPLSIAGAYAVRFLPRSSFDVTFGVLLIGIALTVATGVAQGGQAMREPLQGGRWIVRREVDRGDGVVSRYAYDVRPGLALSGVTGFVATLFGVGGGIIQVPMMATVLRIPFDIAIATSQFMLIFMASSGTIIHAANGELHATELTRAAFLGVGAIAGAQAGAALSQRVSGDTLSRLLALGMILIGGRLVLEPLL
jgi:uncharacterized membrane protein YfcA